MADELELRSAVMGKGDGGGHMTDVALILLSGARDVLLQKRTVEKACGYPDYANEDLLIKRIEEFLSDPGVAQELSDAIEWARGKSEQIETE